MADWQICICDPLAQEGINLLRQETRVDDLTRLSPEELAEKIAPYEGMIVRSGTQVTAALLERAENLKIVARAGVGVDNIDLDAARARGVAVVNTPVATTVAVAEHTLGLLLSLARNIPRADQSLKNGQWAKKGLMGLELSGKTMGIIGVGNIGQTVAHRAMAFGMNLIGYDAWRSTDEIRNMGIEPVSLDELFARSQVISLHTPLTEDTAGMVGARAFDLMQPGVLLLCTARGGLIDEAELLKRLENGQVAGAGLDVFAEEPPHHSALLQHPRVVVTPHIAAQTEEAQTRAALHAAEEILRLKKGLPLRWQIV